MLLQCDQLKSHAEFVPWECKTIVNYLGNSMKESERKREEVMSELDHVNRSIYLFVYNYVSVPIYVYTDTCQVIDRGTKFVHTSITFKCLSC